MGLEEVVIFGLATWRIASLLVWEDGPWKVFRRLRERTGIGHDDEGRPVMIPDRTLAGILSCVWCCSMWVGIGWFAAWWFAPEAVRGIATAVSFSTVAIVVERWVRN